jgi:predicted nicotinamide N-methyase
MRIQMQKKNDDKAVPELQAAFQMALPGKLLALDRPPLVPEIRLWLVDAALMNGPLTHEEAQAVVAEPAYWSFCWASGQVLARWILDHPEAVRGRRVLDVGSGSGVVAIAAALSDALEVTACDVDPLALLAVQSNAEANGVEIGVRETLPEADRHDVICAADILYDRDNLSLLDRFRQLAPAVLLADSRVRNLTSPGYTQFMSQDAITWPDLDELKEFRTVRLFRGER